MYQQVIENVEPDKVASVQVSLVQELAGKEDSYNGMAGLGADGGNKTDLAQQEDGQKDPKETETEKEFTIQDNDTQQVDGGSGGDQASGSMGGESKTDNVVEGEKLTN